MKRDLSILSEYVRISTPDKDRLADLVCHSSQKSVRLIRLRFQEL